MSGSGKGSKRWEKLPMKSTSINNRPYEERCVDPVDPEIRNTRTLLRIHKDNNGNATEPEAAVFVSAKPEPASSSCMCSPCASVSSCRTFMCSVLTCGLYRVCRHLPCLLSEQNSRDNPEAMTSTSKNGFYSDLRIGGIKVDTSAIEEGHEQVSFSPSKVELDSSAYLTSSMDFSTLLDDALDEDVDSLITRKLLEVFSEFEINELAKCTSDSMFLKRSQEISQLISDIVQEHNIKEQEAECRLVREIIRISTRKSKKKLPFRPQEPQRDSGNDTWRSSKKSIKKSSFNSITDGSLKISMERSDDIEARKLRNNSNQSYSPSSPVPCSPGFLGSFSPVTSDTPLLTHSMQA